MNLLVQAFILADKTLYNIVSSALYVQLQLLQSHMSPDGEEESSDAITIWAAIKILTLLFRLLASSSFCFFPDLTETLPLAATNPD